MLFAATLLLSELMHFGLAGEAAAEGLKAVGLKRGPGDAGLSAAFGGLLDAYTVDLNGDPELGYFIQFSVGTPKQELAFLVDTGSSNFAIAGYKDVCVDKYFNSSASSTFRQKGSSFTVRYTEGQWSGQLGCDMVGLPSLRPQHSNLSVIAVSEKLFTCSSRWQGIFGLAYEAISMPSGNIKPYFDELVGAGYFPNVFSLQLCLMQTAYNVTYTKTAGHATFGGLNVSLYEGDFYSVPIVAQRYYEVLIVDILVNNRSLGLDCRDYNIKHPIIDSGTTNILLPSKIFAKLKLYLAEELEHLVAVPAGFWNGSEALCWHGDVFPDQLPLLSIRLLANDSSLVELALAPTQYLAKIANESHRHLDMDCFKLGISSSDDLSIIGALSMTAYYVLFDRVNLLVGFAATRCPGASGTGATKARKSSVSWYPNKGFSMRRCSVEEPNAKDSSTSMAVMTACAVLAVVIVALITLLALKLRRQLLLRDTTGTNMRVQLVSAVDGE